MTPHEKQAALYKHVHDLAPQDLEAWVPPAPAIEALGAFDPRLAHARDAVVKLERHDDLNEIEMLALEAIVLPRGRPVIDVVGGTFAEPPDPWTHYHTDAIRGRLERAIKSVGRVEVPNLPQLPYAGTAFVVGDGLLMTNRHVATIFARGLGRRDLTFRTGLEAEVDFKRERVPAPGLHLEVREIVMVHPWWDMALLRVDGLTAEQPTLVLSVADPGDLGGRDAAVIGYPAKDSRNDADLQNEIFRGVFDVKRLQPGLINARRDVRSFGHVVSAMTHDSSTLGGNSGSAVVDVVSGEVAGLHFAGRYLDANFAVPTFELARDPRVVDAGLNFAGAVPPTNEWDAAWRDADTPVERPRRAPTRRLSPARPPGGGGGGGRGLAAPTAEGATTWTIPLQVTVALGGATAVAQAPVLAAPLGPAAADDAAEAPPLRIEPTPDYQNRPGYDEAFLGAGFEIPLPWLSEDQYAGVAFNRLTDHRRHVLPYHHFSVVMNRRRRLAYYTAVNVDGQREKTIDRDDFRDAWFKDPRIGDDEQLLNDAYAGAWNVLDRGHLVRRLDAVWGATWAAAKRAHDDTFHWTNCSPQHADFNRNKGTWGGVENYILHNANNRNLRVSVFTGPVFRDDDPILEVPSGTEVQIPLEFWKVVAMVRANGTLSATAYLISQEEAIRQFIDAVEFAYADFGGFQVSVAAIEDLTGLSFHQLRDHDPLATGEEAAGGRPRRKLLRLEDVVI